VSCGQGDKLLAAALEKGVTRDKEDIIRVDIIPAVVRKPRKRRIDLGARAGVEDLGLQPDRPGSGPTLCNVSSALGPLAGLTRITTRVAFGASACRSSSRLAVSSCAK
jgi:hypothetical protein